MKVDFDSSKIFFIGGAPRSGTTLMQRILTSHSLVFGGPEFDLIPSVMKLRNMFHASVDAGRISEFLDHDNVDEIFESKDNNRINDFINTIISENVDMQNNETENTILISACLYERFDLIDNILEHKANPNIRNKKSCNVL